MSLFVSLSQYLCCSALFARVPFYIVISILLRAESESFICSSLTFSYLSGCCPIGHSCCCCSFIRIETNVTAAFRPVWVQLLKTTWDGQHKMKSMIFLYICCLIRFWQGPLFSLSLKILCAYIMTFSAYFMISRKILRTFWVHLFSKLF